MPEGTEGTPARLVEPNSLHLMQEMEARDSIVRAQAEATHRAEIANVRRVLQEAQNVIDKQQEDIERLTATPNVYGIIMGVNEDGTVDVATPSGKIRVTIEGAELEAVAINPVGAEVGLNEFQNIIFIRPPHDSGDVHNVKEALADGRVVVSTELDSTVVLKRSWLMEDEKLRAGDLVRVDQAGHIVEKMPRLEVEDLMLEEVPDVDYSDIGGLAAQISEISDAVELPIIHATKFKAYDLPAPKGILLYGPPGCGKTLIAKAVAASIARSTGTTGAYFINVKGPELLNKWVGETERHIRMIFQRARDKAEEGKPVIIFFDEIESLFRTRGSGVSSDMESTIVPQLLAEMDGVESLKNVIVIGASNRQDLIDPAVLRPGRLDVKIRVDRPDVEGAAEIFSKYLNDSIPIDKNYSTLQLITQTVSYMYRDSKDTEFLEVTYQSGAKETLHFKDFASGAMIANIVQRAKKLAIKREIAAGPNGNNGVSIDDLLNSVDKEYQESEDLPNTTSPDDWSKVAGMKGEKIVNIRTLANFQEKTLTKEVQDIATGQYL